MAEILTKDLLLNRKVNSQYTELMPLYYGTKESNLEAKLPEKILRPELHNSMTMVGKTYIGSEGYCKLWNEIEDLMKKYKVNAANFPEADYYSLIDKIRMDITRRRMQEVDYTAMLNTEVSNPAFSKSVNLDEFLPYAAPFKVYGGENDSVALIQQKTGGTGSVTMVNYAVGWKTSLQNILYNTDIFTLQKVADAVARGFVGRRNDLTVGLFPAKTTATSWDSSQQQAADATSGATKEELMYNTLNLAIEKLINLKDPQTGQTIDVPTMAILCRPTDVRRINRAINGQLNLGGKGKPSNFAALDEISEIWPYRGDTIYYGKDKITYPGVASVKAYLLVPKIASYTLVKRPLTTEVGTGSVLSLSQEERAWYFTQTDYMGEFLGSSDTVVEAKVGAGFGFIVEVTLPAA